MSVGKYSKSTPLAEYASRYPFLVPNHLYVVNVLQKLCLELISEKKGRSIEEETDVIEGELREVLPGIVMRVTKPYPRSTILNSE